MTLIPTTTLRPVDSGKWRLEETCGCAFLFEPVLVAGTVDGWRKYHVSACGQRFADEGKHTKRQAEKVAKLPEVK